MKSKSKKRLLALCFIMACFFGLILPPILDEKLPVAFGSYYFIDVNTARIRHCKYFAYFKTQDEIIDSEVSKLWHQYFGEYSQAEWRMIGRHTVGDRWHILDYPVSWYYTSYESMLCDALNDPRLNENVRNSILKCFIKQLESDPWNSKFYILDVYGFIYENTNHEIVNVPSWVTNSGLSYKRNNSKLSN